LGKEFHKGSVRIEVLNHLNLRVEAGESLAIVGASGVGKSTLLNLLGTLDSPTSGQILFNGMCTDTLTNSELCAFRNKTIGFIFQFHYLMKELTALENVMLPALISGEKRNVAREKARALISEVGIENRTHHRPSELSGGEQQRVAIARALALSPQVIFADEPTGNLDPETGEKVFNSLLTLNQKKQLTLIVVTHNMKMAGSLHRAVRLIHGQLTDESPQMG
jgi:lipoprotein-releasing system ATP-binding protein